jgi:hypothetical protein
LIFPPLPGPSTPSPLAGEGGDGGEQQGEGKDGQGAGPENCMTLDRRRKAGTARRSLVHSATA